jgi:hypothetical protein
MGGHKKFTIASWQRRFVTLLTVPDDDVDEPPILRYFKRPDDARPRGFVNIGDVTAVLHIGM